MYFDFLFQVADELIRMTTHIKWSLLILSMPVLTSCVVLFKKNKREKKGMRLNSVAVLFKIVWAYCTLKTVLKW